MTPYLRWIAYAVPDRIQSNEELVAGVPGWSAEKILNRTGIRSRRVTAPNETAADLAVRAAEQQMRRERDGALYGESARRAAIEAERQREGGAGGPFHGAP